MCSEHGRSDIKDDVTTRKYAPLAVDAVAGLFLFPYFYSPTQKSVRFMFQQRHWRFQ